MTATATVKETDLQLWHAWNKTKKPKDLQPLLNHLQPVLNQQVNRWSGALARPVLDTHAKILAVEAINSYDPKMDTALSTHVINRLQKLSRIVYTHTQAARLPEHKVLAMSSFSLGHNELKDKLGRDPTHAELSDHMGWSKGRVRDMQQAFNRQELLTSGETHPGMFTLHDEENPVVGYVYHDMAPRDQQIFEHITGYGGKKQLSTEDLMKKFKLTQGQLSYQKRQMTDLFQNALGQKKQ